MLSMRRLKKHIKLAAKRAKGLLKSDDFSPKYVHGFIPYFSQWESRDLVELIINKQIDGRDDPRWRDSGAASKDEYAEWSWNGCGMACLKMILASTHNKAVPLVELGKKATEYGVYRLPLHSSEGMYYKPLVEFIRKEYGLRARAESALTLSEIKHAISGGGYAVVSVTPEIRFLDKKPSKRSGHLVLVYGYNNEAKTIFLHNPSGFKNTQEAVEVSEKSFSRFFDNKGVLVFGSKS